MDVDGCWYGEARPVEGSIVGFWYVNLLGGLLYRFVDVDHIARSKTLTKLAMDWQDILKKAASEES